MITHLHPNCTCDHRPGDACNASCAVHGIPASNTGTGPWHFSYTRFAWVQDGAA